MCTGGRAKGVQGVHGECAKVECAEVRAMGVQWVCKALTGALLPGGDWGRHTAGVTGGQRSKGRRGVRGHWGSEVARGRKVTGGREVTRGQRSPGAVRSWGQRSWALRLLGVMCHRGQRSQVRGHGV